MPTRSTLPSFPLPLRTLPTTSPTGVTRPAALIISLLAKFALAGCSAVTLQQYKAPPVSQQQHAQAKNGLAVAIHAIVDDDEGKRRFGVTLLAHDILAVHVSAENRSTSSSFVVLPERFAAACDGNDQKTPSEAAPHKVADGTDLVAAGNSIAPAIVWFPPLALVAFPLAFVGDKQMLDAHAIQYNFARERFVSRTLSPNATAHGFEYFKLDGLSRNAATCTFIFRAMDTHTKEELEMIFDVVVGRRR